MTNVALQIPLDQDMPASAALLASQQLFWVTFNSSPAAQIVTELETELILEVNEAYCRMVAYPREALVGHTTTDLHIWVDPRDRQDMTEVLQREGRVCNREYKVRTSSGDIRTQLASVELFELQSRRCIVTSMLDITERKQAEEALRRSEERFRHAFEHMLEGAQIIGFDWRYLYLNAAAEVHNRRPNLELLDNRYMDMWPGIEDTHVFAVICRCMEKRVPSRMENEFVYPDGAVRWFELSIQPIPEGTFILSLDITDRKLAENELRHNEEQYRYLFEHNPHPMWTYDRKTAMFLAVNDAAVEKYGYSRDEFLHMTLADIRPIEDVDRLRRDLEKPRRVLQHAGEWRHRLKDGTVVTVDITSHTLEINGHEAVLVVAQDITERKQVETALRLSEEKYRGLLQSMDNVIAMVNSDGRFLYMNDKAAAELGGAAQDLLGKTMHELFPAPVAARQVERIRQVISTDRGIVLERQTFLQGVPRWYRTSIQPIHDEHGSVAFALVNSTDIDELKRAQQDLLELNRTLEKRIKESTVEVQDLYDNAPAGYHSLDANGRILRINQTELNWLGYTRAEVLDHSFLEFMTPASQAVFQANFSTFLQIGSVNDLEFDLIRKSGATFRVLVNATAIYDADGAYLQSRSTVYDNSARKNAEDALRYANAEMARAVRLKDEFLANMSHELRTPLTGILALGENLQEQIYGPLNERQLKVLRNIEISSRHLLALINDLLDLSKIEAGRLELELQPVVVNDICQAGLMFVKEMAHRKGIQLSYHNDQLQAVILADARRLKQMLVNLLGNAVKFTPEGGSVQLTVTLNPHDRQLEFAVQDTGLGIAVEDQSKLFQPFMQLDAALARHYEGTGLGLALVKRLALQHGGSVHVASAGIPGQGSCFTICLPCCDHKLEMG